MKNKINKKTRVYLSEKVAIAIRKAIIEDVKEIKSDDDFSLALNAAIIGCAAFVASAYSAVGVEDPDKDVARLYRHAADQLERKGGEA